MESDVPTDTAGAASRLKSIGFKPFRQVGCRGEAAPPPRQRGTHCADWGCAATEAAEPALAGSALGTLGAPLFPGPARRNRTLLLSRGWGLSDGCKWWLHWLHYFCEKQFWCVTIVAFGKRATRSEKEEERGLTSPFFFVGVSRNWHTRTFAKRVVI